MKRQQIRIIGGRWRSRRIQVIDGPGLRPTSDRNRETLFNWLAPYLPNAHCLDLFAGSGILSFEALSRGAQTVTLLEKSKKAVSQIKHSAKQLSTEQLGPAAMQLIEQDCLKWLRGLCNLPTSHKLTPFDICFLDPPFHQGLLPKVFALLEQSSLLASSALIYIEYEQGLSLTPPKRWDCTHEKQAGQVNYALYQRKSDQEATMPSSSPN